MPEDVKKTSTELVTYGHAPERLATREEPARRLAGLSREQLLALMAKLLQQQPDASEWLESELASLPASGAGRSNTPRRKSVDVQVYRQRVRSLMRSLEHTHSSQVYRQASSLTDELRGVQNAAMELLDAGETMAASQVLLALLEESHNGFNYVDDSSGKLRSLLSDAGGQLAEVILSMNMDQDQRRALLSRLKKLDRKLNDYRIDGLDVAIAAARFGWNDPPDSAGAVTPRLTRAKLDLLQRRGDTINFLALCLKTGEHVRYSLKLCELARVPEAVSYALNCLLQAEDTLELARYLCESGHLDEAIRIGEHGLGLGGSKSLLGRWLGPVQEAQGRTAQALEAWMTALRDSPSLEAYQTVKRLAGSKWSRLRPEAIEVLRKDHNLEEYVKVLLFEEQWDAAIRITDRRDSHSGIVRIVADAVIEHRPEWVIRAAIKQTEELLARTQSKHYTVAADWLQKTKAAYARLGRIAEWERYLQQLKKRHKRRHTLQSYLARL